MKRRDFLFYLSTMTALGLSCKILDYLNYPSSDNQKQPLIFFGHGSPMNAIEDNKFSRSWKQIGKNLHPKAILVISAHWETQGTKIHGGNTNEMIYDFSGFPQPLYEVVYPAPSNPDLAQQLSNSRLIEQDQWGLDHGAWSVLMHAFPEAKIPVIQLSLNKNLSPEEHFLLAKELKILRYQGVLIVGSGNIVHNLRLMNWKNAVQYLWAQQTQEQILKLIEAKKYEQLSLMTKTENFKLAHPTIEHFLPLLYIFALVDQEEQVTVFTPQIELGTISMASFLIK